MDRKPEALQYQLPEILQGWPWTRRLSPHYEACKAESLAWIQSHHPFPPEGQDRYDACDSSKIQYAYYIRAACDLMNFYYVYDEYTDVADLQESQFIANIAMDAFRNPGISRLRDDVVGQLAQEMWQRIRLLTAPHSPCIQHFLDDMNSYTNAVVQNTDDRIKLHIRNFDDYIPLRRDTTGIKPAFRLVEFPLSLPEEVICHPLIVNLSDTANDLVALINDMHSYRIERARGLHAHNAITTIMNEKNLDIQAAFDWLGNYINQLAVRFCADLLRLPKWGEDVDAQLQTYIDQLGQWVRGNDDWSRESRRYYQSDELKELRRSNLTTIPSQEHGFAKEEEVSGMIKKLMNHEHKMSM
ncbi:isoprenoid synthase domain-containing protein [Cyathus striatus]|nr:isoprenoid synthase domain-containing protein [Cyathus striatus]